MKSRNLPIVEYLDQLQKEYVMYEIRSKIYKEKKDVVYFKNGLDLKKQKIEDISLRNNIKNIFNSVELKNHFYQLINSFDGPLFEYRDLMQKRRLLDSDINYYYSINSDIKIKEQDLVLIGKIKTVDFSKKVCLCSVKGYKEDRFVTFNNISRII